MECVYLIRVCCYEVQEALGTSKDSLLPLKWCLSFWDTVMAIRFVVGIQILLLCGSSVLAIEFYNDSTPGSFHSKPYDCETSLSLQLPVAFRWVIRTG